MKILAVCLGNICRSPLAEGILQNRLGDGFELDSAGTSAYHVGSPPDERSIKVAQEHGIDISHQVSRKFSTMDFHNFDRIYVMDKSNLANVLSLAEDDEQAQKVKLILSEIPSLGIEEVPDPYYGTKQDFEYVYKLLDQAAQKILEQIPNNP